jgi:hypothetical protein
VTPSQHLWHQSQKSIPETFMVLMSVGLCQKEINNWVQIVNSKTGRMPQFNELGLKLPDCQWKQKFLFSMFSSLTPAYNHQILCFMYFIITRLAYTSMGITHMFSIENIRYYPCQTVACATWRWRFRISLYINQSHSCFYHTFDSSFELPYLKTFLADFLVYLRFCAIKWR